VGSRESLRSDLGQGTGHVKSSKSLCHEHSETDLGTISRETNIRDINPVRKRASETEVPEKGDVSTARKTDTPQLELSSRLKDIPGRKELLRPESVGERSGKNSPRKDYTEEDEAKRLP